MSDSKLQWTTTNFSVRRLTKYMKDCNTWIFYHTEGLFFRICFSFVVFEDNNDNAFTDQGPKVLPSIQPLKWSRSLPPTLGTAHHLLMSCYHCSEVLAISHTLESWQNEWRTQAGLYALKSTVELCGRDSDHQESVELWSKYIFVLQNNMHLVHATVANRGALAEWKAHHLFQNQFFSCQGVMAVIWQPATWIK